MRKRLAVWRRLKNIVKNPRISLYISAVFVGAITIVRGSELLIFIALVPLVAYVAGNKHYSTRTYMLDLYAFSWIVSGFANLFIMQLSPENWNVQISAGMSIFARLVSWLIMCGLISLSFALLGFVLSRIGSNKYRLVALVLLFPIAELLRSYLYAIVSYGPGASLSPNYNWGAVAVSVAGTTFVYVSRFVGFFGLSAVALLIASLLYCAWKRRSVIFVGALALLIASTYAAYRLDGSIKGETITVSVLHLAEKEDAKALELRHWPEPGSDLFVLPEYSAISQNPQSAEVAKRMADNGVSITTIVNGPSPRGTNQLQFFNGVNQVVEKQDKTFLIPNGEFLPYLLQFIFWTVGKQNLSVDFKYTQQITPGSRPEEVYDTGSFRVGALPCSGVSALNEYSRLSRGGADVLVNSASLSFFSNKSFYHTFAFNMARYHAVSNRKPFVQASRSGESYILDRQGKILVYQDENRTALLTTQLSL